MGTVVCPTVCNEQYSAVGSSSNSVRFRAWSHCWLIQAAAHAHVRSQGCVNVTVTVQYWCSNHAGNHNARRDQSHAHVYSFVAYPGRLSTDSIQETTVHLVVALESMC